MKKSFLHSLLHSFPYLLLFLFAGLLLLESAFLPELLGKIPERGSEAADYVPVNYTFYFIDIDIWRVGIYSYISYLFMIIS